MNDKKSADLKMKDGGRMGDEEILEGSCARVRPKNSAKEGKVGVIRGVRATLAKMVARRENPISHKQRRGRT